ncbi:tRNA pseudouridine(13) synthase TruD, partial [Candidatus Parvarchaeota archaeon]|nr:tRNA pseudouridine(13) synthase TruD [Candidatus Parvarchaeota archaeon]
TVIPKYLRLLILQSYQYYLFNRTLSEIVKNQVDTKEVPTVGYDFKDDGGEITKIIAGIIEEEKIDVASMKIKEMPEVSLKSFRRQAFFVPEGLEFERQQGNDLKARFSLEKGSYATILLGEFFHSYDFGRTKTEKGYKS